MCRQPIRPGQDWEVSHIDILHEHGGREVGPAHYRCHKVETATVTHPLIAKVKRVRRKHIGAFETRSKLPCGRQSGFAKGFDGKVKVRIPSRARDEALKEQSPFLDFSKLPIARQVRNAP